MLYVILDPDTFEVSCPLPADMLDGHDTTGKTVIEVADGFTWACKAVDWGTLTIIDDLTSVRTARYNELKAYNETKMQTATVMLGSNPITDPIYTFATNAEAMKELNNKVTWLTRSGDTTTSVTWLCLGFDGSTPVAVTFTKANFLTLAYKVFDDLDAKRRALVLAWTQIEAADTLEDIDAVTLPY